MDGTAMRFSWTKRLSRLSARRFCLPALGWVALALWVASAPSRATGAQARFLQVSDVHVGNDDQQQQAIELFAQISRVQPRPDFVAITGDSINSGADDGQVARWLKTLATLSLPAYLAPGNHDQAGDTVAPRMTATPFSSFRKGNLQFFVLDVFGKYADQVPWFRRELAAADRAGRRVVIFAHDALGRNHGDSSDLRAIASEHQKAIIGIFVGHWHANRTFTDNGLRTFVTPTLRMGGIDASPMGYREVTIQDDGTLTQEYVPAGFEHFTSATAYRTSARAVHLIAHHLDSTVAADRALLTVGPTTLPLTRMNRWTFALVLSEPPKAGGGTVAFFRGAQRLAEAQVTWPQEVASTVQPQRAWVTFHSDAARTGACREGIGRHLNLAWAAPTDGTTYSSSPIYADGQVYVGASAWSSAQKSEILALDAGSGKRKWTAVTSSDVPHGLSVNRDFVAGMSVNGDLLVIERATGKIILAQPPGIPVAGADSPTATVVDSAGRMVGGTAAHLAVIDAGGSLTRMIHPGPMDDWGATISSPSIIGDALFVSSLWGDGLAQIDYETGRRVRSFPYADNYGASPVGGEGRVFFVGDQFLHAARIETGEVLWRLDGFKNAVATPAYDPTEQAVYAIRASAKLVKVSAATGKIIWESDFAEPALTSSIPYQHLGKQALASPVVTAAYAWAVDLNGNIAALDKRSGTMLTTYRLGIPTISSPAVSGNTLFITAMDGYVYALTGTE